MFREIRQRLRARLEISPRCVWNRTDHTLERLQGRTAFRGDKMCRRSRGQGPDDRRNLPIEWFR